jgi:hypothetical protein
VVLKRLPRDDLGAVHGLLRSDGCPQERALAGMAPTTPADFRSSGEGAHPTVSVGPNSANLYQGVPLTCHSQQPLPSSADNHGQRQGALDQRRSVPSQVAAPPDLALGAGGRGSSPNISTPPDSRQRLDVIEACGSCTSRSATLPNGPTWVPET